MPKLKRPLRSLVVLCTCLALVIQVPLGLAHQSPSGDCCGYCEVATAAVPSCCAPKVQPPPAACPHCETKKQGTQEQPGPAAGGCCCDLRQLPPAVPAEPLKNSLRTVHQTFVVATLPAEPQSLVKAPRNEAHSPLPPPGKRRQQWLCVWRN